MASKITSSQQAALDRLRTSTPSVQVDYFDYAMEGNVALTQRTIRSYIDGVIKTTDEMYRVHADGTANPV